MANMVTIRTEFEVAEGSLIQAVLGAGLGFGNWFFNYREVARDGIKPPCLKVWAFDPECDESEWDPDDKLTYGVYEVQEWQLADAVGTLARGSFHGGSDNLLDLDSWDSIDSDGVLQQAIYGEVVFG